MLTIHIEKTELVKALKVLKPLTDQGGGKPILANVQLDAHTGGSRMADDTGLARRSWNRSTGPADTGQITLFATDYEASLGVEIEGAVTAPGTVLLPVAKVLEVLKSAPVGPVLIREMENQWACLESGGAGLRFPMVDPGLYPADGTTSQPFRFTVDGKAMALAISNTVPFTQKLEARRNLMGVHLRQRNGLAIWTATDGHRLGRQEIPVDSGEAESPDIIVPRKHLEVWRGALAWKSPDLVTVHFGDANSKHYAFLAPGMLFAGRVIEGKFPSVENIIPNGSKHVLEADPKALKNLLAGAMAVAKERVKPVKFSLESGGLTAESERTANGGTSQRLSVSYRGEPVSIGINAPYAMDLLKLANGHGTVRVGFNGPLAPMLWTYPEEPGFTGVVMPLQIEW